MTGAGASLELWANVEGTQALQRRRASETAAIALPLDKVMSSSLKHSYFGLGRIILLALGVLWMTRAGIALPSSEQYRALVLEIQQHIEQNDLDGARSLIAGAQAKFPANGGLENLLGVIEVQQGHTDRAIQEFSAAILHDPSLASAYLNLGRIYMQTAGTR